MVQINHLIERHLVSTLLSVPPKQLWIPISCLFCDPCAHDRIAVPIPSEISRDAYPVAWMELPDVAVDYIEHVLRLSAL